MRHRAWPKSVYQSTVLIAVASLLLLVFVTVAYFFLVPASTATPQQAVLARSLDANRAKWRTSKPKSFRYVVERHCLCSERYVTPYIATEEPGVRSAMYSVAVQGRFEQPTPGPDDPEWIDDLFARLEQAIQAGIEVQASYDPRYGFPVSIAPSASDAARNQGITIHVRDWEVLSYE